MPTAIAFFPWLTLAERIEIGPVRLIPFALGELPGDQPNVAQADIDAVLGAYANRPNKPVTDAVLLEVDEWRSGMEIDGESMDKLFNASAILAFSALASRVLFQSHFGYVNSHSYLLIIQSFLPGDAGAFVFNARRREGYSSHYWSSKEFAFQRPNHVSDGHRADPQQPLAEALFQLPVVDPVLEAIKEFNAANTDSGDVPAHVELVMTKSAFEWLLLINSKKGSFLKALEALVPTPRGGKDETPVRKQWLSRWTPTGDRLLLAWASDFCALRGESAHGSTGAPVLWDAKKHMAFCAIFLPLAVKLVLAKRKLLTLSQDDLALLDRVEDFLLYDPFESTDKDQFVSAWSKVHTRIRMGVIAQKLYGEEEPSEAEGPAED